MYPNPSTRDLETDPRFPSGEWSGFFVQPGSPQRHWMVFYLEFRGGVMRGEGNDWVGVFHLAGKYDIITGRCRWRKQYLGQHKVEYEGLNQGQGIVGIWTIDTWLTDHFHIWPKGHGSLDALYFEAELPRPAPAPDWTTHSASS